MELPAGTLLRIVGHLRDGGRLALLGPSVWIALPEHWPYRQDEVSKDAIE